MSERSEVDAPFDPDLPPPGTPAPTLASVSPTSDLQHRDGDGDGAGAVESPQNGDRPSPKNERVGQSENHGRIEYTSTEEDCKDRNYYYHYDVDYGYIEENRKYSLSERVSSYPTTDENCHKEDEVPPVNSDKIPVHQHQGKQLSYNHNNNTSDTDQSRFYFPSEEHTYQRKYRASPNEELNLENSLRYDPSIESSNQINESSKFQNETDVDTVNNFPERRNFIQKQKPLVVDQESDRERKFCCSKYNTDDYQEKEIFTDSSEICVVREYVYPEVDNIYQEVNFNLTRDTCYDRYYSYDIKNENIYQDYSSSSVVQQLSQEQHHVYQPGDGQFYNNDALMNKERKNCQEESHSSIQNCNPVEESSIVSEDHYYERNFQGANVFHREGEGNSAAEDENRNVYENDGIRQGNEASAVDLRILRPLNYPISSNESFYNVQDPTNVSHSPDDACPPESTRENATISQNTFDQEYNSSKISYIIPDQICYEEECSDSTRPPQEKGSFDCDVSEITGTGNRNFWDAGTNTEHTTVEDKECQTGLKEVRDIGVQTDVKPAVLPFTFLKNIQEEVAKYSCPICQRVYISKYSFDRHVRTHEKEKSSNVITNVRFTTEAKLQICKRVGETKILKERKPIIIRVPSSSLHCDICERSFHNQREKDNHQCIFKPFPLTKCPECHIKFYTTGALNEHIGIVHKKENAYSCIFCNKSFNAGYSFHLHLDEHLSLQ